MTISLRCSYLTFLRPYPEASGPKVQVETTTGEEKLILNAIEVIYHENKTTETVQRIHPGVKFRRNLTPLLSN